MSNVNVNTIADLSGNKPVTLVAQWAARSVAATTYLGGVPVIQESENQSSLTDTAVGNVDISLTNSFVSTTYGSAVGIGATPGTVNTTSQSSYSLNNKKTGGYRICMATIGGTESDYEQGSMLIGELA